MKHKFNKNLPPLIKIYMIFKDLSLILPSDLKHILSVISAWLWVVRFFVNIWEKTPSL